MAMAFEKKQYGRSLTVGANEKPISDFCSA